MLDAAGNAEAQPSLKDRGVTLKLTIRGNDSPNVRKQPSTSGKVVGHASPSAEYEVLDVSPGAWFLIRLENGNTGWVSSKMGSLSGLQFDFEAEPAAEAPAETPAEAPSTDPDSSESPDSYEGDG